MIILPTASSHLNTAQGLSGHRGVFFNSTEKEKPFKYFTNPVKQQLDPVRSKELEEVRPDPASRTRLRSSRRKIDQPFLNLGERKIREVKKRTWEVVSFPSWTCQQLKQRHGFTL